MEFENGAGTVKGSVGYNAGTDYTQLVGVAGCEINTTNGPINLQALGDKINMTTNGNNIEIFGNTTAGIFANVNIGTSDGTITLGGGGDIIIQTPTEVNMTGTLDGVIMNAATIKSLTPTLQFNNNTTSNTVVYNATGSIFAEPALITNVNEIQVATGATTRLGLGYNTSLATSYVSGGGGNLFLGEDGANSYSGIVLGDLVTGAVFIDRKDDTNVTQSAATITLAGTGQINIESQLATGGIGITTLAAADIVVNSGADVNLTATNDLNIVVGNAAGKISLDGGINVITAVAPVNPVANYLIITINSIAYKIALAT